MNLLRPAFIAASILAASLAVDALAQGTARGAGAGNAGTAATGAANGNATNATTGTTRGAATPSSNPLATSTTTPSATTSPTGSNLVSGGNAFSGSSRGDVPPVGSAAVDANGVNVNGFGTGLQSGAPAGSAMNGNSAAANAATGTNPSPFSSDVGTGVIYPGAPYGITDTTGMTGTTAGTSGAGTAGYGNANGAGANAAGANGNTFTASGIATPQLDAATRREARRERAAVARGGQTLNTIAPRTNVDRTNQMPDDPVSPALATPDRPVVRY